MPTPRADQVATPGWDSRLSSPAGNTILLRYAHGSVPAARVAQFHSARLGWVEPSSQPYLTAPPTPPHPIRPASGNQVSLACSHRSTKIEDYHREVFDYTSRMTVTSQFSKDKNGSMPQSVVKSWGRDNTDYFLWWGRSNHGIFLINSSEEIMWILFGINYRHWSFWTSSLPYLKCMSSLYVDVCIIIFYRFFF